MDPLSAIGAFIAVLQISGTIISCCYDYRKSVRSAPRDLARVLDEVSDLRNVVERLIRLIDDDVASGRGYLPAVEQMTCKNGPLERCQSDLESIKSRLESPLSEWKAFGKRLAWPLQEKDVLKSLETVKRTKSLIESALSVDNSASIIAIRESTRDLHDTVLDFQRDVVLTLDTQVHVILDWLGAADQSPRFQSALEKRCKETGSWLLARDIYRVWRSTPGSFWVHGIREAGCGKTILCSTIIEDTIQFRDGTDNVAVAYYYFDFGNKLQGTMEAILRSLLSQLLIQAKDIPDDLGTLARLYSGNTGYIPRLGTTLTTGPKPAGLSQPPISKLVSAFQGAITEFNDIYLVIDALDECVELDKILDFLETVLSWKSDSLHLLVTSRSKREIEEVLSPIVPSQLLIKSTFISEDIVSFIQSTLEGDRKLRKWSQKIKDEIKTTLLEGSQGMFQWVDFQLQALRECLTPKDVKKALNTLPKTLNATYTRVLENINGNHYKHAMMVLKLLALSHHPVQVQEASEFIAFDFDASDGPRFDYELRLPEVEDILAICSGLVSMNTIILTHLDGSVKETIRELHLAHFSVKEFLLSHYLALSPRTLFGLTALKDWNSLFAQCCLVYLNQLTSRLSQTALLEFPAARYSAQNWIFFAQSSPSEYRSAIEELASQLLHYSAVAYRNWICLYDHDMPWKGVDFTRVKSPAPIYHASAAGLEGLVNSLLRAGENPNASSGIFGSSLEAAIHYDHTVIVRLLISAGADLNASKGYYGSPLMTATVKDREDIVKLLLENGAKPKSERFSTPTLLEACQRGQSGIVKLLLEAGANPNAYHEKGGGNPVETATRYNHLELVSLLLPKSQTQTILGGLRAVKEHNATEMMKIYSEYVPDSVLYYAADMGRQDLVIDMLNRGASNASTINRRYLENNVQASAIVSAAANGHEGIVRQLIRGGANVNSGTEIMGGFEFALGRAAEAGHFDIAKLLLENKSDTGAIAARGDALQRAAYIGHKSIVELLLDHGADINQANGLFGGAVQGAVLGRHMDIVKLLLGKGADIDLYKGESLYRTSEVKDCHTPLEAAVVIGDIEMTQYLLTNGAKVVNAGKRTSLLSTAASKHDEAILKILLNAGADIDYGDDSIGPPLFCAIAEQQLGSMKFLIKVGANVKAQRCLNTHIPKLASGSAITPLSAAVSRGFEDGVRLLLEHQVDIHATSKFTIQNPETPLHTAARQGFESIARHLLECGANANEQIEEGWTPLHFAARYPSSKVVRVLVEEFKADMSLTLLNGSQAIHSAADAHYAHGETSAIISTLIDAGTDVNVCNNNGRTPLHWAAERGNFSAVQTLLERGARVDVKEETNMTPLDIAKMKFVAEPEHKRSWEARKQVLEELEKRI